MSLKKIEQCNNVSTSPWQEYHRVHTDGVSIDLSIQVNEFCTL